MISRETPYLKYIFVRPFCYLPLIRPCFHTSDSGGQYRDGTCDTTRTVHFGRPTQDQSEAYTRVVQGHVCRLLIHID